MADFSIWMTPASPVQEIDRERMASALGNATNEPMAIDLPRGVGAFFRDRDADVEFGFEARVVPGDDEEDEKQEDDIDHGGEIDFRFLDRN